MSFEKFLIDEEMGAVLRRLTQPIDFSAEAIDLETMTAVGIGGQYLTQPKTLDLCRTEFYRTDFFERQKHADWQADGGRRMDQVAGERLSHRLAAYEKPPMDPGVERALSAYIAGRKNQSGS